MKLAAALCAGSGLTGARELCTAAFALFGAYSRARADWQLSGELYDIAAMAVSDERARRQQSIAEFCAQWEAARQRWAREVG